MGYSPRGRKESDMTEQLTHTYTHTHIFRIKTDSFFKIFLMWVILKVFIEFVTMLLLCYILVSWPGGV